MEYLSEIPEPNPDECSTTQPYTHNEVPLLDALTEALGAINP